MESPAKPVKKKSGSAEGFPAHGEKPEKTMKATHIGEMDTLTDGANSGLLHLLQGARDPYRVMVETMNEGAATLTAGGIVLYANRRFAEILSMPAERLTGSRLRDIVQITRCPGVDELLERTKTAPQKEECNMRASDGKLVPVYLSLSPLRKGDFLEICVVATDLTEQKRKEKELAQLSGRLLRLQDEERRRLARELHDSTSQTLSALAINLALIQQRLTNSDSEISRILSESHALAAQASQEIRNLSQLLHPPDLDAIGLVAAIRWYALRISERGALKIRLDIQDGFGRLDQDVEFALFRVAQESLTNVQRHSGSSEAAIRIFSRENEVVLEVQDKGQGMPAELLKDDAKSIARLGVGIGGMQERLRQLGGRLEIVSNGQGTTVRAFVPLQKLDA